MMAQKNVLVSALFVTLALSVAPPVFSAEKEASAPAEFVLSQEEFVRQRKFMLSDLDRKITLLQAARACADKSSTPDSFVACNKTLNAGIAAHMGEMRAEANKKDKNDKKDK